MNRRGSIIALGAALISGVSVYVNARGVKAFGDATAYTTAKNATAAVILLLIAGLVASRRRVTVPLPSTRAQWAWLAVIGVVGGSAPFVLFFEGLARTASGPVQAQFIHKTLVVWVAVLAVPLLGERLGLPQLTAIALLVTGQAALSGGVTAPLRMSFGSGEAMIFAATLLWAVEVIVAKRLLGALHAQTVGLARMVFGSAVLIGWVSMRGKAYLLSSMDAAQWRWILLTGALLAAYVATWLTALALAPAVEVTAILVAAVPVTAVLQAIVDGSALRPQLDGLTLILAGCAVLIAAAARLPARSGTSRRLRTG
jgi:drug/metabolite transporter (DMT)-like permease